MKNDVMTQAILDMKTTMGKIEGATISIKEKVDSHDELLKQHSELLNTINNRTIGLDSWKNGIIHNVVEEKEKALSQIRQEIKPLQDEFQHKIQHKVEVKGKINSIMWGGIEKITYIIVGSGFALWLSFKNKLFQ